MGADAMCLCGSSPGPLADVLFPEMLREARARGIPTLLDTYGEALRLGLEAEPTIVKVNRAEAAALLGRPLDTLDEQMRALDALRQAGATQWSILTLGADGALCASDEGCWQAQPPRVAAINTIGSGDAMTAGLLTGLLRGQSPQACFRLGMAAAVANTLTWDAGRLAADDVQTILPQIRLTALS
jgi:fructose-1-phosphate kinase PfkB-like protein